MIPLAPEVPLPKRQTTLEGLLARLQANLGSARGTAPVIAKPRVAPVVAAAPVASAKTATAAPAQEKIDAFDDRWSTPTKPAIAAAPIAAKPAATPASPEKIDAFDDRWSTPAKPAIAAAPVAKPVAPAIAPKTAFEATVPTGPRADRLSKLLERITKNRRH